MRILTASIVAAIALFVCGCADKTITLRYDAPAPAPVAGPKLTLVQFADRRGTEGDRGDPYRIGGIYGGYGNRLAKVTVNEPWPAQLMAALVAEFRAQGVDERGHQRSEEHTSELQSLAYLVCRLLLEKKKS